MGLSEMNDFRHLWLEEVMARRICTAGTRRASRSPKLVRSVTQTLGQLGLEPLERRRLLASINVANGVLTMIGDALSTNYIVDYTSSNKTIIVQINSQTQSY